VTLTIGMATYSGFDELYAVTLSLARDDWRHASWNIRD
jgi:hypothetical protein